MNLYTVYDRIAEESGPVFEAKNDGVAMRMFLTIKSKTDNLQDDYKLLRLGSIDHQTSMITVSQVPIEVVQMTEVEA